jgi:hypothetical protein
MNMYRDLDKHFITILLGIVNIFVRRLFWYVKNHKVH